MYFRKYVYIESLAVILEDFGNTTTQHTFNHETKLNIHEDNILDKMFKVRNRMITVLVVTRPSSMTTLNEDMDIIGTKENVIEICLRFEVSKNKMCK